MYLLWKIFESKLKYRKLEKMIAILICRIPKIHKPNDMDIDFSLVIPALVTGIILGAALSISKLLRGIVIVSTAAFIVWIFVESGEAGIVQMFEWILYNHVLVNPQFYLPVIAGSLVSIALHSGKTLKN